MTERVSSQVAPVSSAESVDVERPEGLRERKKRRTRQQISDIATALFVERGFDEVPIAEVARRADVSVNTVYNYFSTKEDLIFDRADEVIDRSARMVREREVGESAARAILRRLRAEVARRDSALGLFPDFARFLRMVHGSAALLARLSQMRRGSVEALAAQLVRETGSAADDPEPLLMAAQLSWIESTVFQRVGTLLTRDVAVGDIADEVADWLDRIEGMFSRAVLEYAPRLEPAQGESAAFQDGPAGGEGPVSREGGRGADG